MSRCATAWQRRPRRQWLRRRKQKRRKRKNDLKIWFGRSRTRRQELMAREPEPMLKILADNDIHRLVRVTAF